MVRGVKGPKGNTKKKAGGKGKGPKVAPPEKKKTAAELDAEMSDYFMKDAAHAKKKMDSDMDEYFKAAKATAEAKAGAS